MKYLMLKKIPRHNMIEKFDKPYRLTQAEIASLKREMQVASDWADQKLRRRYPKIGNPPLDGPGQEPSGIP